MIATTDTHHSSSWTIRYNTNHYPIDVYYIRLRTLYYTHYQDHYPAETEAVVVVVVATGQYTHM